MDNFNFLNEALMAQRGFIDQPVTEAKKSDENASGEKTFDDRVQEFTGAFKALAGVKSATYDKKNQKIKVTCNDGQKWELQVYTPGTTDSSSKNIVKKTKKTVKESLEPNIYVIPCVWEMYGTMHIEADSLEEAVDIARAGETPLPEGSYVEDSFVVDEELLSYYNNENGAIFGNIYKESFVKKFGRKLGLRESVKYSLRKTLREAVGLDDDSQDDRWEEIYQLIDDESEIYSGKYGVNIDKLADEAMLALNQRLRSHPEVFDNDGLVKKIIDFAMVNYAHRNKAKAN